MAVQKNFSIRNGLEVNEKLLVADSVLDRVGIGSTTPKYTFEVIGGIGATDINILGISTVLTEFNVGTGGTVITSLNTGLTGFGTQSPAYIVDIRSPVSTGQTALYVQGDVRITGDVYADDINLDQATFTNLEVTGVSTIAIGIITTLSGSNLNYSGIGSFGSVNTPTARITTGIVTTIDNANLRVSGIASINTGVVTTAYINTGIVTNLSGTNLNYTGVTTVGDFSSTGSFDSYAPTSTFHGNVTIDGNVTVGGTSGIINAVELRIEDKDLVLGFTTTITPTDDTANHGGIAIASTEGTPLVSLYAAGINTLPDTYKQIMWVKRNTMGAGTTDAFLFNYGVGIGSTQVPNGVKLSVGSVHITDDTINTTNAILTNLNASGVTTSNSYNIGATQVISSGRQLQNIASLDATTTATIEAAIANAPNTFTDITVSGLSTFVGVSTFNSGVYVSGIATFQNNVSLADNANLYIGTGNDLRIFHNGSNSFIQDNGTGNLFIDASSTYYRASSHLIQNASSSETLATFTENGSVALYFDNVKEFETTGYGATVFGTLQTQQLNVSGVSTISTTNISGDLTFTGNNDLYLKDSGVINFGDSNDLQIYHNGVLSVIREGGTGGLLIDSNNEIKLGKNGAGNDTLAIFTPDGSVELYYDNVKEFETTGYGATVFGTLQTQQLNVSGLSTVANFRITPIGSGATVGNSGIVTYYGDGSQLSNIISGVGIQSAGTLVGTGFTTLNFIGAGNTFAVNGTTIDISISGGAGAGGTWTTYNAGIATSKSVGVHTSTIDNANLTGVGNSFQGLYVANGMIIVDNQLNGDHYIGTSYNGLMAGPVTINGTLTVDGNYVVV
jgi:hypothetical protein